MAKQSRERGVGGLSDVLEGLPMDELKEQTRDLMMAMGERALTVAIDRAGDFTDRFVSGVSGDGHLGGGLPVKRLLGMGATGVKEMITSKLGGASGKRHGGGKKLKLTNIVEQVDVGVPVRVAYNQWTQFQDFPKFTKKVEQVEQQSDEKLSWKAGIFLSHRTWESTIVEQVPDELIVWRSKGAKGYVDGTVTFHELAPNLTKILLVLEYHPHGFMERTGNLWRAQGRRTRLELKHFRRHVMRVTILDPESVEGWRGEIHDGEVVRTHEEVLEEEGRGEESEDEYDGEAEDRAHDKEEPEEESEGGDEAEDGDNGEEEAAEDKDEEWKDEPEDEYEDDSERAPVRSRRRKPALSR